MRKIALTLLALAFLAAVSAAQNDKSAAPKAKAEKAQKISGWITDEKCASAKGTEASHIDCAKKCIDSGIPAVFVSDKGKKIYKIDNQDAAKAHAGHHVKVAAHVTGDSMHIESVTMLKQPKPAAQTGEHKPGM